MDIKQLRYFMTIVDNNFNLSRAAELLYVSQPTLSMMINEFERKEDVILFKRKRGRISGLTYLGENYYKDACEVLDLYNKMFTNLHNEHIEDLKGTINIGIPPLVLSLVFSTIMPKMILDNPNIKFNIKESGAYQLKNDLLLGNVDIAALLSPTGLADNLIETYEIQRSELAVFLSPKHPLAKKKILSWKDLNHQKLAIFDSSFMINHLLMDAFERHQIHPNIILMSGSWDFMLNATKINHDIMTILPNPTNDSYNLKDVKCIKLEQPIIWKVVLARLKKENYNKIESYINDSMIEASREKQHMDSQIS